AHVLQAAYNALYFSQMVYPDFDHFQSHNPNALFHAIARAINDGPIYVTDDIGEGNFDVLRPLIYSDGRIIRSDEPLLPALDCLFQVQDPQPFKCFSRSGSAGLLGIWNCADADSVSGVFRPSDVHGIQGERFAVYERIGGVLTYAGRDQALPVSLGRLGCRLYYIVPLTGGMAPLGLIEKYNAPATLLRSDVHDGVIGALVYEGGKFAAVGPRAPARVTADGIDVPFTYSGTLIVAQIPPGVKKGGIDVRIRF
ncbi:MAG TPA: Sip1-related alpha-galactosidase, partial [Bacteroidota bacterium]|nr:Sip1-related alpha-galactosidase [Bacteroidota bacterium]